jgi:D-alanyl-D-alanine carboxypeptidase (penicillin-binding protein 5/6)
VIRPLCLALAWIVLIPLTLGAQDLVPDAPSAVLLDQLTGRILFQKQPNLPIPPASLTKLMTLHLAWKALAEGRIHPGDLVPVTAATTGAAVPPGSSLMFLEPGQRVTVRELMLGLAVDSGNDAGLTLAQFLGGNQPAFVDQMNAEARSLELPGTVFFDAYGYDARNRTTAGDFARFCRFYLQAHPQSVQVLHNIRELAYPLAENLGPGSRQQARTIVQPNRNTLLGAYQGADGLKTGYIDESGYNLAATALRGDQRLVAVLLGVKGKSSAEGTRLRTAAAARLLDFGFGTYPLRPLPLPEIRPVRLWYSQPGIVVPVPQGPTVFPLTEAEWARLTVAQVGPGEWAGPVPAGFPVAALVWSLDGKELYRVSLTAAADPGPWWTQAADSVVLFFRSLTGAAPPKNAVPRTRS